MNLISNLTELEQYLSQKNSESTRDSYERGVRTFVVFISQFYKNISDLNEIKLSHFIHFKNELDKTLEPNTVNLYLNGVKGFFKFLHIKGHITHSEYSLISLHSIDYNELKTSELNGKEIERMLYWLEHQQRTKSLVSTQLMFLTLINSGLRIDELLSLKMKDIQLNDNIELKIKGKGNKTRYVTLSKVVSDQIKLLMEELVRYGEKFPSDSHLIRGYGQIKTESLHVNSANRRLNDLAQKAKVKKKITCHSLRRTFCTMSYLNDVPLEAIARIMGHSSTAVTMRYIAKEADKAISKKYSLEIV